MAVVLIVLFVLGVANFAMHSAVLDSGHPLFARVMGLGWFSLGIEYLMLVGCMLMSVDGGDGWAWTYAAYTAVNATGLWLILSGRLP